MPNPTIASHIAKLDTVPPKAIFTNIGIPTTAGPITNKLLKMVRIMIKRNVFLLFK